MSDAKRDNLITSASGLERALACTASLVLPRTHTSSEPARRGTVIHQFIEMAKEYGREKAIEFVQATHPDYLEACEPIDLDALPLELAHEVAFAYDCATGKARELGRGSGYDYRSAKLSPTEIPGTADVVGVTDDSVLVEDYKTGYVKIPADSMQNRFLALCAMRVYDKPNAVVAIRQRRDDETFGRVAAELDEFDADELAEKLSGFHARHAAVKAVVEAGRAPNVYEGDHCRYCPAFHSCPAKTALAVTIGSGAAIEAITEQLTPVVAASVWLQIKALREVANRVERHIYAMAKEEPIDLGNGTTLGEKEKRGNESLDGTVVYAVMAERHGEKVARASVKFVATKKGIKEALRGNVPKVAPAEKDIMAEVRKRDGATRKATVSVMEYPTPS